MKSSFCSIDGCVDVEQDIVGRVIVRSTKNESEVMFSPDEWDAFVKGVKAGEFDTEEIP